MDVATVKKNYVDPNASAKSKTSAAEKLMGDFSKAVTKRMNQLGSVSVAGQKNALVGNLTAKTDVKANTHQAKDYTVRNDQPSRNDKPVYRDLDTAPKARDDAPVQDNAPSPQAPPETTHNEAPDAPADQNQNNTSQDDQSAPQDTSHDDGADKAPTQAETTDTNDTDITGEAAIAAVTQLANVSVTKADGKQVPKTKGIEAAAAETTAPQQKAQKGADAANVTSPKDVVVEDEGNAGEALKKDALAKGKDAANQAKAGPNTHVTAEGQADVEKGATVAQQQASELSKKIGSDQALDVKVSVKQESDELVSKPSANLIGQAKGKNEGESLTPTAAQATPKGPAGQAATHTTGGQTGSDAQSQNQQQAQFQAGQADATKLAANFAETKTQQTVNTGNTSSQVAKVGGAEGASATSNAAPTANTQQTQQTQQAAKPKTAPQQNARTAVADQVTVQISKAINDGNDKIRIQLKPAHLGRIDVQLDVNQDGRVTAVISADNKDTMDLLKQDSRELEKAMREAGLNLSSGDLSFNLRGQNGNGGEGQGVAQNSSGPGVPIAEPTLQELLDTQPTRPQIISEDRVDITA